MFAKVDKQPLSNFVKAADALKAVLSPEASSPLINSVQQVQDKWEVNDVTSCLTLLSVALYKAYCSRLTLILLQ